ncbi:alpha/beta hydrolase family protein [Pseudooceanicola sp. LIPI14-2-Ac024]|uniref:alpha/beta hydrolase family protein n=1 Tax=Pseudooceanicola sp. LIPI14-2-Ac024 TaxID=3344875 RepID=UPI0035D0DDDC
MVGNAFLRLIPIALSLLPTLAPAAPLVHHYPAEGVCPPVLILSHGLGGSEAGLSDLAHAAAGAGFDTWVMGHPASGMPLLKAVLDASNRQAALEAAVTDASVNAERAADLDSTLHHVLATAGCTPPLMVMGGHSMGAQTAIIEAGARNNMGVAGGDRFDAYVALSSQGVGGRFPAGAWADIEKPVLMVTGTSDRAVEGDWTTRLTAWDNLPADGRKQFAVIAGATHRDVSGTGAGPLPEASREIVVDFLTGLLSGEPALAPREGVEIRRK